MICKKWKIRVADTPRLGRARAGGKFRLRRVSTRPKPPNYQRITLTNTVNYGEVK